MGSCISKSEEGTRASSRKKKKVKTIQAQCNVAPIPVTNSSSTVFIHDTDTYQKICEKGSVIPENEAIGTEILPESSSGEVRNSFQTHHNINEPNCSSSAFVQQFYPIGEEEATRRKNKTSHFHAAPVNSNTEGNQCPRPNSADKSSTREKSDREKFEMLTEELDKLMIHWPGDGRVQSNDDEKLKQFMEYQYPDWKNPGKLTSIPSVTIPRMMVRNDQLSTKVQKQHPFSSAFSFNTPMATEQCFISKSEEGTRASSRKKKKVKTIQAQCNVAPIAVNNSRSTVFIHDTDTYQKICEKGSIIPENEAIGTEILPESSLGEVRNSSQTHHNINEPKCSSSAFVQQFYPIGEEEATRRKNKTSHFYAAPVNSNTEGNQCPRPNSADKSSTREKSGREKFEMLTEELDKLEIHSPGDGRVQFIDDEKLKQFMEYQYPDWINPGKLTSIPSVTIPRMMVRNDQLSTKVQKQHPSSSAFSSNTPMATEQCFISKSEEGTRASSRKKKKVKTIQAQCNIAPIAVNNSSSTVFIHDTDTYQKKCEEGSVDPENEAIGTEILPESSLGEVRNSSQTHHNINEPNCSSSAFVQQFYPIGEEEATRRKIKTSHFHAAPVNSNTEGNQCPRPNSADKSSTREKSDREKFEMLTEELDKLEIHWPGDGRVQFNDDEKLKQFMEYQYPDWKNPGKLTSIPSVRIPRMMVRNDQLSTKLQKQYKSLQKGEMGESKVYKLFVNEVSTDQCGIMIFPNVDGSHIFEEGGPGSVEIDMIVAHPTKGIFVFNIKNEQNVNIQKLRRDIRKHSDFIRHIMCYGGRSSGSSESRIEMKDLNDVPIHSVICYLPGHNSSIFKLADEINLYALQQKQLGRQADQVIVFQKAELRNFAVRWAETILKLPIMEKTDSFDTLVARLGALNSMEENSSSFHQKIITNDLQAIKVRTSEIDLMLAAQIDGIIPEEKAQGQLDLITTTKALCKKSNRGKVSVILWTKEQLEIIGTVFKGLTDPSKENNPLRINVKGAKGTGKTMLMVHLAQLARSTYQNQQTEGLVAVCDGSGGAKVLFSNLKQSLQGSGILFLEFVPEVENLEKGIIFVDEDPISYKHGDAIISQCIETKAHLCIFSSINTTIADREQNDFTNFYLTYTLRSSKQLQMFTNNVHRNWIPSTNEINGFPSHNLDGTNRPNVIYVECDNESEIQLFVDKCVETVMRYAALPIGMNSILVVISFLSPICQSKILSILKTKQVALRSISYGLSSNEKKKKLLPIIQVESINAISGSEFQTVVIILENMVFLSKKKFRRNMMMAVTRASTNLAIVAADTSFFSSALEENEISTSLRVL